MASTTQVALGCIVYALVWLLLLKNEWRIVPLGRAVGALTGACVCVGVGVLTPEDAFKAVNIPTLALLTGCMLVSAHMEAQGLYSRLAHSLSNVGTPLSFLLRVSLVAGVSSACITNDTSCVILTRIVGQACAKRKLHPAPYLLALATCANVGSACSPIGNPQNMLIALTSGLTFIQFLLYIALASILGLGITVATIVWRYRRYVLGSSPASYDWSEKQLAGVGVAASSGGASPVAAAQIAELDTRTADGTLLSSSDGVAIVIDTGTIEPQGESSSANMAPASPSPARPRTEAPAQQDDIAATTPQSQLQPSQGLRRKVIMLTLILFPLALLLADKWIGLSWVSLLVACVLCVIYGRPPAELLSRVDGNLLLFFSGLFVVVDAFNRTGVPESAWAALSGSVSMDTASGLLVFTVVVLIASNIVSNVPLVLLLSPKLLTLRGVEATAAWAELAWISTVAGNFTLLGSVANLIVAEQAKSFYDLTFLEYLFVGAPSTLLLCAGGVPLVRACVNLY